MYCEGTIRRSESIESNWSTPGVECDTSVIDIIGVWGEHLPHSCRSTNQAQHVSCRVC
jgi:hypothetical protein